MICCFRSPSSKKKDSSKPKGRPKKTPSGSVTKDSVPDDPVDTTEADIDDAHNGNIFDIMMALKLELL